MAARVSTSAAMSDADLHADRPSRGFVELIGDLARASGPDGLSLGEVVDRMDERAFGLLILILAIPCLVPALYGVPQIIGVPILILAGQLVVGRKEPWLPDGILRRRIGKAWLDRMADFAAKRMGWVERLSKPRLTGFVHGMGDQVAGVFMIIATLTIVLPMTNTVPSLALALLAAGLLQRDGLFVLAGAAVSTAWAGFLVGLPVAAFVFGFDPALQLWDSMFGWLQGLFG
jgi:hypothetical protein